MNIEKLRSEDFVFFLELQRENLKYHQQFDKKKYAYSESDSNEFRAFFAKDGVQCLLAKNNGIPVGYIVLWIRDKVGIVCDIFVNEGARGMGIGHALLLYGLKWFSENNIREVNVKVDSRNYSTIRFYEKSGFVYDEIVMNKTI